jgi:hypothetical protein
MVLAVLALGLGLAGLYPHLRGILPGFLDPERLLDLSRPGYAAALDYVITLRGLPVLAGICLAFAVPLLRSGRAGLYAPLLALALFTTVLAQPLALITAPSLDTLMSPRPQAELLRAYEAEGFHVSAFYVTSGTYTFYMGAPVDEIDTWEELRQRIDRYPRLAVAIRLGRWEQWQARPELEPETFTLVDAQWIAERQYVVLVRNRPDKAPPNPDAPSTSSTPDAPSTPDVPDTPDADPPDLAPDGRLFLDGGTPPARVF